MWRRVARNSRELRDQLIAYQNSIDCLQVFGYSFEAFNLALNMPKIYPMHVAMIQTVVSSQL